LLRHDLSQIGARRYTFNIGTPRESPNNEFSLSVYIHLKNIRPTHTHTHTYTRDNTITTTSTGRCRIPVLLHYILQGLVVS